jgi:hypothetical protein
MRQQRCGTDDERAGRRGLALALALAALSSGGCELWDFARNPTITFKLPMQTYAFSTDDPRWKSPPAAFSQKIDCTTAADCCVTAPAGAPPEASFDCSAYSLGCDAGQCAISFPFELLQPIDLARQVPALAGMNGKVVSSITLQSLDYMVINEIGVGLPAVGLSVAPARATSATGNPDAHTLATLPPTAAGATVGDTILLTTEAKQAFRGFARDFQTPFNFIASTTMSLRSGSPPPKGKVTVKVTGTVTAAF